jgi:glutamate N-acetyltransferase/amino-acid N-acetyltransferase
VFQASTGVIGEPLPHENTRLLGQLGIRAAGAGRRRQKRHDHGHLSELATATAFIDGHRVTINGIAKGSGMIAPDMATMLAFAFTDANIPAPILQSLLADGAQRSFNCITVDSDTSTSDTLLLFATGKGGAHPPVQRANDKRSDPFREKLNQVLLDLALQVVKDGEGDQADPGRRPARRPTRPPRRSHWPLPIRRSSRRRLRAAMPIGDAW